MLKDVIILFKLYTKSARVNDKRLNSKSSRRNSAKPCLKLKQLTPCFVQMTSASTKFLNASLEIQPLLILLQDKKIHCRFLTQTFTFSDEHYNLFFEDKNVLMLL